MTTITLKIFKVLYPDYKTFKEKIVDPMLLMKIGAGVSGNVELPIYMDDSKMFYKYETLYIMLYNRYSSFVSKNEDDIQHGLMQNALMSVLPMIHGKTIANSNAAIGKLDINKLLATIDKRYNEEPDTNYASTETGYTSTPSGADGNMGNFDIKKTKDKNLVLRKDGTIRIRELTNLIDKYGKLKDIELGAYVHNICNTFPFASLWELQTSEEDYIVEVPGIQGKDGKQGPPGPSGSVDVYEFTWNANRKNDDFWNGILGLISTEKYPQKIIDGLTIIVNQMKLLRDTEWKDLNPVDTISWIDVCNNILIRSEKTNAYQYVAEETKLLKDAIANIVQDELKMYTDGTNTPNAQRWIKANDGTSEIDDLAEDRYNNYVVRRRYKGSDLKSTTLNIGIHEALDTNIIDFLFVQTDDGKETILKRDAYDSYVLFSQNDKTIRIGFQNKKPMHFANGNLADVTLGQAAVGPIIIGKDAQGPLAIGSAAHGVNGNTGHSTMISGNEHCLFSEIIAMVNAGVQKQYLPAVESPWFDVDSTTIHNYAAGENLSILVHEIFASTINIYTVKSKFDLYWQGVLLTQSIDYEITGAPPTPWGGQITIGVRFLKSLQLIDTGYSARLTAKYLTVIENVVTQESGE